MDGWLVYDGIVMCVLKCGFASLVCARSYGSVGGYSRAACQLTRDRPNATASRRIWGGVLRAGLQADSGGGLRPNFELRPAVDYRLA